MLGPEQTIVAPLGQGVKNVEAHRSAVFVDIQYAVCQPEPARSCNLVLAVLCSDDAKAGHLLRRLTDVLHAISNHIAASESCRVGRGLAALCTRVAWVESPLR